MPQQFDLDAYLARINYKGPLAPTYDTLAGILPAHIASIPFESFDVLLGRPVRLDSEGLQAKIVTQRRGGLLFRTRKPYARGARCDRLCPGPACVPCRPIRTAP